MTIEKQLEALRKALEMGANIEVRFFSGENETIEDAYSKANGVASVLSGRPKYKLVNNSQWFKCRTSKNLHKGGIEITSFGPILPKEQTA